MSAAPDWATINPNNIAGFDPTAGTGDLLYMRPQLAPTTGQRNEPPWYSPDSALFWFGVVLAASIGFYAVSIHVKAGPAKAALNL